MQLKPPIENNNDQWGSENSFSSESSDSPILDCSPERNKLNLFLFSESLINIFTVTFNLLKDMTPPIKSDAPPVEEGPVTLGFQVFPFALLPVFFSLFSGEAAFPDMLTSKSLHIFIFANSGKG